MKNLKDLRVLVTGGGQGLGRALAEHLTREGARVAVFARSETQIPGVFTFRADISKKEDTHRIAAVAQQNLGAVDVVIHNASTLGPTPLKILLDTECEDFESVLQTNLLGPFRLTKALLPGMIARKRGLIVNISSDAAINGYPAWGAYSASKAALDQTTRVLNAELEGSGVRAVSVDPGDMRTAMHFAAIPSADPAALKDPALSARQLADWIAAGDYSLERFKL